jgi:hypothetical protein
MMKRRNVCQAASLALILAYAAPASAALDVFKTYVGSYGLSTDGGGSVGSGYGISAFVPVGATVTAAYLYQATYDSIAAQPVSLNGNALTFTAFSPNATACCSLASARADVTSLVSGIVDGGPGGTYNFNVTEGASDVTDGTALVVVYSLASLSTSTVAILDGFASVGGDTAKLTFGTPLDTSVPGFGAEMRLGIGFSCCGQQSTVNVNGTTITDTAGNNDDGLGSISNGQLITVGGNDDPFSPFLPAYEDDHERYNLAPYITTGDTSITVRTSNASQNDNIFLAAFRVSGEAGVVTAGVPEPATWAMMLGGFGLVGGAIRRHKSALGRAASATA